MTRQLGETLYKSLENFQASVEASRKKELLKMAAMEGYQVRVSVRPSVMFCAMGLRMTEGRKILKRSA